MPNLLFDDPNAWTNTANSSTPPSQWDEGNERYAFIFIFWNSPENHSSIESTSADGPIAARLTVPYFDTSYGAGYLYHFRGIGGQVVGAWRLSQGMDIIIRSNVQAGDQLAVVNDGLSGTPYDIELYLTLVPEEPGAVLVAVNDAATTVAGVPISVPVLANDTLDGVALSLGDLAELPFVSVTAQNGSVVVNLDGTLTYTPNVGFSGVDTFTYQIETPDPVPCALIDYDGNNGGLQILQDVPSEFNLTHGSRFFVCDTEDFGDSTWYIEFRFSSSVWSIFSQSGPVPSGGTEGVFMIQFSGETVSAITCASLAYQPDA